jgi:2-dehydro-3-deoxygluconokinase
MKVLSFGEILLRMSPAANGRWIDAHAIATHIGGAECNVAVALGNWNIPVKYVTAMPDNYFNNDIIHFLASKNIDTSGIQRSGNRIGLYYLPQGADLKNAGTIYDRYYSSFYDLKPGDINWDDLLKDVTLFHFSALTPAINETLVDVLKEALEAALERNIYISVDLNYRPKLWQYGKQPIDIMPELAAYADIVMGNIWASNKMLGTTIDDSLMSANTKAAYVAHALKTSEAIQLQFPKCKTVANTFRFDKYESGINYYTTLFHQQNLFVSAEYEKEIIMDRSGSGDCFMAGLLYGLLKQNKPQDILDYATAAAFSKLDEVGDHSLHSEQEVLSFLKTSSSSYE